VTGPLALVDQGSTSTKAVLLDARGRTLASAEAATPSTGHAGRIAHDAEEIAVSVLALLGEVSAEGTPAGVGLACQRSTCLLWERETGAPLSVALSWQDTSTAGRLDPSTAERVARITGLRLSPHYAAPKLAALLDERPDLRTRAETGEVVAGTLDAFLVHRLTGRPATEPGHAGRSLLYDLERDAWSEELCALFGVPAAALPDLRPSVGPWGETPLGAPLVAVAGDQQAALVGQGGWEPGVAAAHFGTGAFVLASTGATTRRHPGLLTAVLASTAAGRQFQIEGSVNSAGSAVDWAVGLTGEDLGAWAERPLSVEGPPWLFPALAGAAAPWWRPEARGVLAGLALGHEGPELLGAVLAGVAHRVVDCVEALREAGVVLEELRLSGRLTRLSGLVQGIADLGRLPVRVSAVEETGLSGLAALARAGLEGTTAGLTSGAPAGRRLDPALPAAAADSSRARWRVFATTALDLGALGTELWGQVR